MDVIFEFLGKELIENVITCMNYQIDKVVYFGYQDMINNFQYSMEKFLKTYCAVKNVENRCIECTRKYTNVHFM